MVPLKISLEGVQRISQVVKKYQIGVLQNLKVLYVTHRPKVTWIPKYKSIQIEFRKIFPLLAVETQGFGETSGAGSP